MKRTYILLMLMLLSVALTGCSVVFSSYLSGTVYDKELSEQENAETAAIADAEVYLYSDKESRDADYDRWFNGGEEDGQLPRETGNYFQYTKTDEQGEYAFSGFTWKEVNPEFGKTADRQNVYLLVYHKDYGLQKNTNLDTFVIVSDVDNTVPDFFLSRFRNRAQVTIELDDTNTGNPIDDGIPVRIYVAKDWSYNASDQIIDSVWPETPSYEGVTNGEGKYAQEVSFPMKPNSQDNKEKGPIRIIIDAENYVNQDAAETDSGWNAREDDEDNFYEKTIEDKEYVTYTWELKKTVFENQQLTGFVYDDMHGYTDFASNGNHNVSDEYDEGISGLDIGVFMEDPDPNKDTVPSSLADADHVSSTASSNGGDGYFSFTEIHWKDSGATKQSEKWVYVYVEDPNDGANYIRFEVKLYGDAENRKNMKVDYEEPTSP
jgi:hypothetical protein